MSLTSPERGYLLERIDYDSGAIEGVAAALTTLVDHAGDAKGFGLPPGPENGRGPDGTGLAGGRASLSTKHTLALTNRGTARTQDLLTIARAVRDGVADAWGITLHPEPVLVGCSL